MKAPIHSSTRLRLWSYIYLVVAIGVGASAVRGVVQIWRSRSLADTVPFVTVGAVAVTAFAVVKFVRMHYALTRAEAGAGEGSVTRELEKA